MTEYMDIEVKDVQEDLGYLRIYNRPFNGFLDNGEPYIVSTDSSSGDFDSKGFIETKLRSQKSEIKEENLELICISHYQDKTTANGEGLFPCGVTMSLWRNENNDLKMYSSYLGFSLEATIDIGEIIDRVYTKITKDDASALGLIELTHRRGTNIEEILEKWSENLKKTDSKKASEIYLKLFNYRLFHRIAEQKNWNHPLRQNPLLLLTYRSFLKFFNQPSIAEKFAYLEKHLYDRKII